MPVSSVRPGSLKIKNTGKYMSVIEIKQGVT